MSPDTLASLIADLTKARTFVIAAKGARKPVIAGANMTMVLTHINKALGTLRGHPQGQPPGTDQLE